MNRIPVLYQRSASFGAELKTAHSDLGTSLDLGHGRPHYQGFIENLGLKP
jgi:hypothetical protein